MATSNDVKFEFEQLVRVICSGEMPNRKEVLGDAELDALVDVLNNLDSMEIEAVMEATGGGVAETVAAADGLLEVVRRTPKPEKGNAAITVVPMPTHIHGLRLDGFSLAQEVFNSAHNAEVSAAAEKVVVHAQDGKQRCLIVWYRDCSGGLVMLRSNGTRTPVDARCQPLGLLQSCTSENLVPLAALMAGKERQFSADND